MFYTVISSMLLFVPTLADKGNMFEMINNCERSSSADFDIATPVAFLLLINFVLIWTLIMLMRYKTVFVFNISKLV